MVEPTTSRPEVEADDFVGLIDNPFLPLLPGSVWVYQGEDTFDIVRVTDDTKQILGVGTTVVFDVAYSEGEIVEVTFDWFAQDEDGNVWYFGEDTKELENGRVVSIEGSWQAGVDGAEPGIVMQASPRVGDTYAQENAPGIAEDAATIRSVRAVEEVPFGSFDGVLETHEFTPLDPSSLETKYYASGVGHILTVDEPTGEREELVWFKAGEDPGGGGGKPGDDDEGEDGDRDDEDDEGDADGSGSDAASPASDAAGKHYVEADDRPDAPVFHVWTDPFDLG
ncbi:MAG TPA: hypothetical protein VN231_01735 [Allosphingosinicella sp.]|nr:hypothetical protein [Allosphingosinicella sp.]